MYKNEEEFLKNYDSSIFEKLSMTTDILLLSVSDEKQENYRKTTKKKMSVLLIKRDTFPFKDKWCLPGGFLNPLNETLEDLEAPELWLNPDKRDFFEFDNKKDNEDIKILKYKHHGKISFPIAQ